MVVFYGRVCKHKLLNLKLYLYQQSIAFYVYEGNLMYKKATRSCIMFMIGLSIRIVVERLRQRARDVTHDRSCSSSLSKELETCRRPMYPLMPCCVGSAPGGSPLNVDVIMLLPSCEHAPAWIVRISRQISQDGIVGVVILGDPPAGVGGDQRGQLGPGNIWF